MIVKVKIGVEENNKRKKHIKRIFVELPTTNRHTIDGLNGE